ncbi:hypothetical protein [Stenotrophomonas sp. GD03958]|uniref:hypothetical protein n=1 Tax=Stenotrophomonas sp. GD03958 TaxID=2975411 RepID=UPI00244D6A5D|nr:hypothetical protein [Stenotrophomonas sp. GD03958]MDH1192527.1 hypothetical protein [Stenotrophomonas sp. GD03958]
MTVIASTDVLIEDLAYLARNMRPDEIAQDLAMTGAAEYDPQQAILKMAAVLGPKFVLLADNVPVVAGGFWQVRPGVWEGWQLGTMAGWEKHWRAITKITRRLNDKMLAQAGVHRLQLYGVAGRDKTFEWYERSLGYRREATLSRYCANGADAVLFARTKETG